MSLSCHGGPPLPLVGFGVLCRQECYWQHQLQCNSWRHWAGSFFWEAPTRVLGNSRKNCHHLEDGGRIRSTDYCRADGGYFQITIRAQCAENIGHFKRTNCSQSSCWRPEKKKKKWKQPSAKWIFPSNYYYLVDLVYWMASIDDQAFRLSNRVNTFNSVQFHSETIQPLCSVCLLGVFFLLFFVVLTNLQGIYLLELQPGHYSLEV